MFISAIATVGFIDGSPDADDLGPELLTNGDFEDGATGWDVTNQDATHIVTFADGTMRYQSDTESPTMALRQFNIFEVDGEYEITAVCSVYVSGSLKSDDSAGVLTPLVTGLGTFTARFTAVSTAFLIYRSEPDTDVTLDSISIREVLS